ncbi:DUF4838 domain-containing protein [Paenibacillus sp. HB172176]|uniref:DUF4838 domain-containing protein n=1 Tax=Paenibacillus sp. HB172176 TaxID=2493690 RepID=UPI001439B673|nr:DUF4838 domain-containing protein [Paenibacillus sp. HB172176]
MTQTGITWNTRSIRIIADKGAFSSIKAAASAELGINWWNNAEKNARTCTVCYAATELAEHLSLISQGTVELVPLETAREAPISDKPETGIAIWLEKPPEGSSIDAAWQEWLHAHKDEWETLPPEGYAVATFPLEGRVHWVIAAKDRSGSLYGAYALLEALGFRWIGLGEQGRHVPDGSALSPPLSLSIIDSPSFETRGVYSEHIDDDSAELLDWLGRNRINFASLNAIHHPHAFKKRGIRICMGGHNILYRFLNPRDYAEAHPDWFGLVNGERSFNVGEGDREGFGDNFCTTNPHAVAELCYGLANDLIDGQWRHADVLNFWMLDNGNWCECDRCQSTGNYAYRMILLVHALRGHLDAAEREGRLGRHVHIIFPIYHETLPAPDRALPEDFDYGSCFPTYFPIERCFLHTLDDECCTESNQELMTTFVPWTTAEDRHYKGNAFVGEYYNVGSFAACPIPLTAIMKHDLPFYYRSGIRHFHYMHLTDRSWGTLTLTNYQLYRMLWNILEDADRIVDDYYSLCYGDSAADARSFYESLEKAMRNSKFLKHYQYSKGIRQSLTGRLRENAEELFPLEHMQYDLRAEGSNAGISLTETVDLLAVCRRFIDRALDGAREAVVVARLLEDERRFSYLEDMVRFIYGLVRTHQFHKQALHEQARNAFLHVQRYALALEQNTEAVRPSTRFDLYDNGLKASWCEKAYLRYKALYFS